MRRSNLHRFTFVALYGAAAFAAACGGNPAPTGMARITAMATTAGNPTVPMGLPKTVETVVLYVTDAAGTPRWTLLALENGLGTFTYLALPVGDYALHAIGTDASSTPIYEGTAVMSVDADAPAQVTILLQPVDAASAPLATTPVD